MQADEQMIETEAVAYIKTTNANSGLLVDTLVLPNTNPTKTMILCHGAGKNKAYFQNLNATYGFAPTANVRIMLPTSNHYAGKRLLGFCKENQSLQQVSIATNYGQLMNQQMQLPELFRMKSKEWPNNTMKKKQ